jgi:hypothetical protein
VKVGFYFDEHINPAIARGLRLRGVDVLTVQDDRKLGATDDAILARATELGRVVLASDTDYISLARRAERSGLAAAGVVFVPFGSVSIGRIIDDLEVIAGASDISEWQNRIEHLPL